MYRLLNIFLKILIVLLLCSCNNTNEAVLKDAQTDRAQAEAEASKQKKLAAEAELKSINAQLRLMEEKQKIEIEDEQRLEDKTKKLKEEEQEASIEEGEKLAEQNKADANFRKNLGANALEIVRNNHSQILTQAYPLAGNKLKFTEANLVGTGEYDKGYNSTVRLNYRNLFRKSHFLELKFDYDKKGGYRSWKFVNHSDVIAPKELTVGTLLKLVH